MSTEVMVWVHVFVRRPSSASQLSHNLMGGFLSNFSCCLSLSIGPDSFFLKKKGLPIFHDFVFVLVNMGPYWSKDFKLLLPQIAFIQYLFPHSPLRVPDKSTVLGFWNFEFSIFHEFCSFSLTWNSMGAKNVKSLLLPQIAFDFFQTSPEISSQ